MSHLSARQCRDVVQTLSMLRSALQTTRFLGAMGAEVNLMIDGAVLLFTLLPMLERVFGVNHSEYEIEDDYERWNEWDIWPVVIPDLENAIKCANIPEQEKLELKQVVAMLPQARRR